MIEHALGASKIPPKSLSSYSAGILPAPHSLWRLWGGIQWLSTQTNGRALKTRAKSSSDQSISRQICCTRAPHNHKRQRVALYLDCQDTAHSKATHHYLLAGFRALSGGQGAWRGASICLDCSPLTIKERTISKRP